MSRILYYGIFFNDDSKKIISSLDVNKLEVVPDDFHVTFRYLPNDDERVNDVIGKWFTLKIVGYQNNGKNSGLLIEIPDEIITLSISNDSKNRYTRDLNFKKLDKPVVVKGRFGYCIEKVPDDKTSRYITFEKVL